MAKDVRKEVVAAVTEFKNKNKDRYGYAYTSGYFETLVVELVNNLPARQRDMVLTQLRTSV